MGGDLQGVLFDMDGTLLDSEKLWDVALEDLATALGGDLSPRARQRMVGSSLARSIAIMHDDLGIEADPQSSGAYLSERAAELFRTALVWKPGARQLLHAVHDAGVPAALVTSTNRPLTEIALDTLGRELFAASVCGDEVVHRRDRRRLRRPIALDSFNPDKTQPDRFRRPVDLTHDGAWPCVALILVAEPDRAAAALIGAIPDRCVAIEDSPLGVAAAEAAGCAVLAVPSEVAIEPAPTRSVRDSLTGLTVQHLAAMVHARSDPRIEPDGQQA